jgi:ATP/ADP translocase
MSTIEIIISIAVFVLLLDLVIWICAVRKANEIFENEQYQRENVL